MKNFLFIAIVIATHFSMAAGAENWPKFEELQPVLPLESQHRFTSPHRDWKEKVSFMSLGEGSFVVVDHPTAEEKKKLYKEIRYFEGDSNQPVKILNFYPDGTPYSEIDRLPEEQFTLHFFSNGAFSDYTHWKKWKWIAGIAENPETKKENHFFNGTGSLITHETTQRRRLELFQGGNIFLKNTFQGSILSRVELWLGNDGLIRTGDEERLNYKSGEYWSLKTAPGSKVAFSGISSDISIPNSLPFDFRSENDFQNKAREIQEKWDTAYAGRRSEFLERFEKIMTAEGYSWKNLGLEFIPNHDPWPSAETVFPALPR